MYKQGQAGVTKASVSITFNNSDRSRSPVGYEHCDQITVTRQIVIGGRNKYMINGQTAQPTRVQNLFHSVQLNVNNPHFLIMQGRITKVLNMKPPEILSMLEEAAGTRMYESKKETALKTLDKKQTKVDEIDKLLEEEILPTIEKLRRERGDYMKWAAGNDALERLRRFCVAYEFSRAKEAAHEGDELSDAIAEKLEKLDLRQGDRDAERQKIASTLDDVAERKKKLSLDASRGGPEGDSNLPLAKRADDASKALVREKAAWTHKKEAVKGERQNAKKARADADKHDAAREREEARLAKLEASHAEKQDALAAAETNAVKAENTLLGVQSGTGAGGDGNKSLQTQLAEATKRASESEASVKAARMRAKHAEKERKEAEKRRAAKEKEGGKLQKELEKAQSAFDAAKEKLQKASELDASDSSDGSSPKDRVAFLESSLDAAEKALRDAQEKTDVLNGQLAGLDFKFRDPEAKFDRSRVKGVVAKLMRVTDPAMATALEVVAGGKLYQVVVDTETTGKALLSKGQLQKRVTIIPLNKIDARGLSDAQIARAATVSNGDAKLALSLVTSDPDVESVMRYVFGKAFVCSSGAVAREVAFDKNVLANCVTVEGDMLNPGGLLTGGSRGGQASVLKKLHAMYEAEAEKADAERAFSGIRAELARAKKALDALADLEADADAAEHALGLVRAKLEGSEAHQLAEKVVELTNVVASETEAAEKAELAKKEASELASKLEEEIRAFASERDARLADAEKALKAAKSAVAAARADIKAAETEMRDAKVERESAAAERAAILDAAKSADDAAEALEAEAAEAEARVVDAQAALDALNAELETHRAALAACDAEAQAMLKARQKLERQADADAVERKTLEHKRARAARDAEESAKRLETLERDFPWIPGEAHLFGVEGSEYDFEAKDAEASRRELDQHESAQAQLSKRVNKKVIAMFDKAEAEFKALQEKRRIVVNDRTKIEAVISELDEKKKEALRVTWTKVNADFGSIFSTLLPSTTAKLEPPEGESFLAGLEVKVAFGGVWKESLTELSGGQRSLLALSLILALLLFKPAPIYILDEVDAALDLSHTQNIGRMIRQHFPFSQFIVVSLKEGMFNNANCIFRTKFVDGVSTVTRTVPALKAAETNAEKGPGAEGGSNRAEATKKARGERRAAAKENAIDA